MRRRRRRRRRRRKTRRRKRRKEAYCAKKSRKSAASSIKNSGIIANFIGGLALIGTCGLQERQYKDQNLHTSQLGSNTVDQLRLVHFQNE